MVATCLQMQIEMFPPRTDSASLSPMLDHLQTWWSHACSLSWNYKVGASPWAFPMETPNGASQMLASSMGYISPNLSSSMGYISPKVIQRRRQRSRVSSRRQHFNLHLKASSDHLHSHPEGQRWRDWLVRVWLWFYWCTCHANILSSIETILYEIMWRSSRFVARIVSWKSVIGYIGKISSCPSLETSRDKGGRHFLAWFLQSSIEFYSLCTYVTHQRQLWCGGRDEQMMKTLQVNPLWCILCICASLQWIGHSILE